MNDGIIQSCQLFNGQGAHCIQNCLPTHLCLVHHEIIPDGDWSCSSIKAQDELVVLKLC